ncbi:MAG TPA: hypothetical protein EYP56_16255 [Planctomycetaceae bacterium]|nr:hypothetical protein [Planctomycetaceae bacterium]HIQ22160.1 hypothetical protein [Planctomycetota bacterium]
MGEKFDPYRDALVVEQVTVWPAEFDGLDRVERERMEAELHARPQEASELAYVRLPTGFARHITVTPEDIERLKHRGAGT